jgi:hypothetical protein
MDNSAAEGGTGDSPPILVEAPDLTGHIPVPVTGDRPVTGFYGGKYWGTARWITGGQVEAGIFREGVEYEAEVTLYPATGYGFPEQVTVTHRGTGESAVTFTRADDGTISGAVSFPATNAHPFPVLTDGPTVSYDSQCAIAVSYAFDMDVTASAPDGWIVTGSGTKTITAAPTGTPGTAVSMTLAAANKADETKIAEVSEVTVMPVSGVFSRPASGEAEYTVAYYDSYGAVGLKSAGGTGWFLVTDAGLKQRFNALYTPNAPDTDDGIESGKTAAAYTQAVSEAVLGLFSITLGSNADGSGDKYEIKGTDLPAANAGSTTAMTDNLIVIDIGLPGGGDNSGLPVFHIPYRELGDASAESGAYSHIRFRVNSGAEAVILADNTGYIGDGDGDGGEAGTSCPPGYFNGGCIEVMSGGKLRDEAYEGFPLGSNAVILSRLGSYLAVGPEEGSEDAQAMQETYDAYYSGWFIGPPGSEARIEWEDGGQNGDYIEVRLGELVISANVTVKKTLGGKITDPRSLSILGQQNKSSY